MANTLRLFVSVLVVNAAIKVVFPQAVVNAKATNNNPYCAGSWIVRALYPKDNVVIDLYTSGKLVTSNTTVEKDNELYQKIEEFSKTWAQEEER